MENLPSLPGLAPDEPIWRPDWFGECAYPRSGRRYAQPCIKVTYGIPARFAISINGQNEPCSTAACAVLR